MKKLFTVILAFALMGVLCLSAAAAGESELLHYEEITVCPQECTPETVELFESAAPCWESGDKAYKDTLDGDCLEVYELLETCFLGDTLPTLGSDGRWDVGTVVTDQWPEGISAGEFAAWSQSQKAVIQTALRAFTADHPECFFVTAGFSLRTGYSGYLDGTVLEAAIALYVNAPLELDSAAEIAGLAELESRMENAAEAIVQATEGMPTVARLAYFDNWLAENNDYNLPAAEGDYPTELPWSPLSGLLDVDEPVCEGYAKAFQLLCHKIGVPCVTLSGTARGGGHMWTAVKLGESWFFCDPTWDDPIYGNTGKTRTFSSRAWFLIARSTEHTVSPTGLPSPVLSELGFFENWALSGDCLYGGRSGSGELLVALYDEYGRMTDCRFGYEMYWLPGQTMLVAPDFAEAELAAAGRVSGFVFGKNTWTASGSIIEFN